MNQICAMSKSLLSGEVLSIMNCFKWFGVTNAPREMGRSIERKFGVKVSRTKKEIKTRYGQSGYYFEYRLNFTEYNKEGIQKMRDYIYEIESQSFNKPIKKGPKIINKKTETNCSTQTLF